MISIPWTLLLAICGWLTAGVGACQDPHPGGVKMRLGVFFWHESPNDQTALDGIAAALLERGRPHELIVEQAGEDPARAAGILDRFTGTEPVDLVFAMGTQAALLCAERITDLPVVFTAVTNPVESGVVPAWTGSGRNLAGNSNWIAPGTVLRVFQLAVPNLTRLGLLRSSSFGVVSKAELRGMRRHLEDGGGSIEVVEGVIEDVDGIAAAVDHLVASGVQAIWVPIDFLVYENMPRVLDAARRHRIPLVSSSLRGAESGAVAGVLVDYAMLGKRAVVLAVDILERGKNPGDLPIGTMQGYRVVVNLDAARRCAYELPLSLLVLADRILEAKEDGGGNGDRDR